MITTKQQFQTNNFEFGLMSTRQVFAKDMWDDIQDYVTAFDQFELVPLCLEKNKSVCDVVFFLKSVDIRNRIWNTEASSHSQP